MYSSQEWWSNTAGGDGPDPGEPIGQSLRFRGSSYLNRSFSGTSSSFTFSFWTKINNLDSQLGYLFSAGGNDPSILKGQITAAGKFYNPPKSSTITSEANRFRDPSAWYHVMYVSDEGTDSIYVNGELVSTPGAGTGNFDGSFVIGGNTDTSYTDAMFQGYMAEWHGIDGQALSPTAFGRVNENGNWVPKKIDFSTAAPKYSEMCSCPTAVYNGAELGFDGAFDGDLSTNAAGVNENPITFSPEPGIEFTTLRVMTNMGGNGKIQYGGVDYPAVANGSWTEVTTTGTISKDYPLVIAGVAGVANTVLVAIEVDGVILTDPYNWTSQLFTSPGYGSIDYSSTAKLFQGGSPAANGFDGQTTTFVQCDAGNSWFFKPQGLTATKIEIQLTNAYGDPTGGAFEFNGVEQTGFPGQSWYTVYEGEPITDWTLGGWYRPDGGNGFSIIRVNGVVLRDGVNPYYGSQGFYLNFSDRTNVGKDYSGNGNDFSNSGVNIDYPGLFQEQLVSSSGLWQQPPSQMFDGSTGTYAQVSGTGATMTFTPSVPIEYTSLHYYNNGASWELNGTTTGGATGSGGWQTIDPNPGTLTSLTFLNPLAQAAVSAIGIGGTGANNILVSNTGEDYDIMQDSPTNNTSTLNHLIHQNPTGNVTYSAADSRMSGQYNSLSVGSQVPGTQKLSGKQYWECTLLSAPGGGSGYPNWGVSEINITNTDTNFYGYHTIYISPNGYYVNFGTDQGTEFTFGVNDTVGFAFDNDTKTLQFYLNGVLQKTSVLATTETEFIPYVLDVFSDETAINFGQSPFLYPVPAGYNPVSMTYQEDLPFYDVEKHFQTIGGLGDVGGLLYSEDESLGGTNGLIPALSPMRALTGPVPSGGTYTPSNGNAALSWIWDAGGITNSATITFLGSDSGSIAIERSLDGQTWVAVEEYTGQNQTKTISGGDFRYVRFRATTVVLAGSQQFTSTSGVPILAAAQQTFSQGLYWIKDRVNENQWQLVNTGKDKVTVTPFTGIGDGSNQQDYVAPSGESWAALWNAPETWSSTGITEGYRNREAGFSMFQYTGNGTRGATVPHGLGQRPAFFILNKIDPGNSQTIRIYHQHADPTGSQNPNYSYSLRMDNSQSPAADAAYWGDTIPTDELITLGESASVNGAGSLFQCYAWAEIPGYSKFGVYTGAAPGQTADYDANFIYTGFKPAFLWLKGLGAAETWLLRNNIADIHNPRIMQSAPSLENAENSGWEIDFLCNGFKNRSGDGQTDARPNGPYMYIAFAEMPFTNQSNAG